MQEKEKRKDSAANNYRWRELSCSLLGVNNYFAKSFEDTVLSWLHNLVQEVFLEACDVPVPENLEVKDPVSLLEVLTVYQRRQLSLPLEKDNTV